ncbi:conjugative transposon protein TraM [Gaoshiqia sediminis]|uniref:Conjugative transposon protein TraM n=1 Tax=Gaoshiqia sediminis TaxID=2986998 RepID=A0AA42C7A0_9BACT|nr:conjugative transposon protein TraM [Gaoshiqia sediminis]MCW0481366.1 conjugative transposon protein TraM [Gaoshiqia sediminis]
MKTNHTFLKKNKALLILPLALLPFVVLIFYILGGGKKAGQETSEKVNPGKKNGANYELPEAEKSIEIFDKMEAYQNSQSRVVSTQDYHVMGDHPPKNTDVNIITSDDSATVLEDSQTDGINANVSNNLLAHIKDKEAQVRKEMEGNNLNNPKDQKGIAAKTVTKPKPEQAVTLQKTGIEELDQVFDENIALSRQNDSLKFYLNQTSQKPKELEAKKSISFSLEKNRSPSFDGKVSASPLIKAEVYETTTVLDGNRIKMRLLEDCQVGGKVIQKNSFIYGICQIKNERLHIRVSQLPTDEDFLPVDLMIHDLDGLAGLYVPDNATRKVAKEVGGSTNTSSLFGVTPDPLTYAGVRAADRTVQSLFKMVRLKKVTIKKNTLVYLINQK